MASSAQGKGSGGGVGPVDKEQNLDTGLEKSKAGTEGEKTQDPGVGAGDSPKRQGDKLEHATNAAASKPKAS